MSGFTAEWLALREPADWRARSSLVTRRVADTLSTTQSIRAIDLAAGTGSNAAFLSATLASPSDWLLVDRDRTLLDRARGRSGVTAQIAVVDFTRAETLDGFFSERTLVTASALLDLVSDEWLAAVCALCRKNRSAVLFALSYDGRIECVPSDPDDETIRGLVNHHQRTDKGFGQALGPDAGARAAQHLNALGYQVIRDQSDWVLGAESAELQRQVIEGWAGAAIELAASDAGEIRAWRARRIDHVNEGRSQTVVGHEDVGAFIA